MEPHHPTDLPIQTVLEFNLNDSFVRRVPRPNSAWGEAKYTLEVLNSLEDIQISVRCRNRTAIGTQLAIPAFPTNTVTPVQSYHLIRCLAVTTHKGVGHPATIYTHSVHETRGVLQLENAEATRLQRQSIHAEVGNLAEHTLLIAASWPTWSVSWLPTSTRTSFDARR